MEQKYRKYKEKYLKEKVKNNQDGESKVKIVNITPQTLYNIMNSNLNFLLVNTLSNNLFITLKNNAEIIFMKSSGKERTLQVSLVDLENKDMIILYCANYSCNASIKYHNDNMKNLKNVYHFKGGMFEWLSMALLFSDKIGVFNSETNQFLNKRELQELYKKNMHLLESHKYKKNNYEKYDFVLQNSYINPFENMEFKTDIERIKVQSSKTMQNKVCVVTGGTSGLGLASVKMLLDNGAKHVTLTYFNNFERANKIRDELSKNYNINRFHVLKADARTVDGNMRTFNKEERKKYLNDETLIPVNCVNINAGIFGPANLNKKHVHNISVDDYDKVMDINLKAYFLGIQHFVKQAIDNNVTDGSVVCIKSIYGSTGSLFSNIAYQTSKHGVMGLVRQSAIELARENKKLKIKYPIRVNAVSPTFTNTALTRPFLNKNIIDETIKNSNTNGKLPQKEDVANAVMFLLSDNSKSITGIDLPVDCGVLAESVPTYSEILMLNNQNIDELSCCGEVTDKENNNNSDLNLNKLFQEKNLNLKNNELNEDSEISFLY